MWMVFEDTIYLIEKKINMVKIEVRNDGSNTIMPVHFNRNTV